MRARGQGKCLYVAGSRLIAPENLPLICVDAFLSAKKLVAKIEAFVAHYSGDAPPSVWTATADSILKKVEKICNSNSHAPGFEAQQLMKVLGFGEDSVASPRRRVARAPNCAILQREDSFPPPPRHKATRGQVLHGDPFIGMCVQRRKNRADRASSLCKQWGMCPCWEVLWGRQWARIMRGGPVRSKRRTGPTWYWGGSDH